MKFKTHTWFYVKINIQQMKLSTQYVKFVTQFFEKFDTSWFQMRAKTRVGHIVRLRKCFVWASHNFFGQDFETLALNMKRSEEHIRYLNGEALRFRGEPLDTKMYKPEEIMLIQNLQTTFALVAKIQNK